MGLPNQCMLIREETTKSYTAETEMDRFNSIKEEDKMKSWQL